MKTLTEIKAEKQTMVNKLITESLMFFAFNNNQFDENKTTLQESEKYIHIGSGAYMPKGKLQTYLDGNKVIDKWYKAEIKANKARRDNIIYELSNYECYYTHDIDDAVNALGSDYTHKEIQEVFYQTVNQFSY